MLVSAAVCIIEERKHMEGLKDFITRLGEKLFPDLPERKRNRITVQVIIGVAVSLVCIVGMGVFRYT